MKKIRLGIIFGGKSVEHEVSIMSTRSIVSILDSDKYDIVPVGITKKGQWITTENPMELLSNNSLDEGRKASGIFIGDPEKTGLVSFYHKAEQLVLDLKEKVDIIFPVLHGTHGEDGTIQGLFEMADIPYVGCGVLASSLGMDKAIARKVFRQHNIPVVDDRVVLRKDWEKDSENILSELDGQFAYPCFVKPVSLGSSVGVSKARNKSELEEAINIAFKFDRRVLIEEGIHAREIECSVLGNDDPIASIPGEIVPGKEFYDYEAKYLDSGSKLYIPADIPRDIARKIQEYSIESFKALECSGMARVDFFLEKNTNKIYLNEVNTIPGFTKISMYPKMLEASGVSYKELVNRLIELGLERHREKEKNVFSI